MVGPAAMAVPAVLGGEAYPVLHRPLSGAVEKEVLDLVGQGIPIVPITAGKAETVSLYFIIRRHFCLFL